MQHSCNITETPTSFVSRECDGCKVDDFEAEVRGQKASTVSQKKKKKKSTGKMRTRTRARGRPPAPRDSEPRRGLGLGDNSLATSGAPEANGVIR